MAFATAATRARAIADAGNTITNLRTVYLYMKQLIAARSLYLAGTDPVFNAAFDALFTAADRTELSTMINQLVTLIADWEANHADAISGG